MACHHHDLADLSVPAQERKMESLAEQQRRWPFDLEKGPMIRIDQSSLAPDHRSVHVALPSLCADAMGLKYWQSMRLIVLPQALKISIPGIVNSFIGLYKDSTLVIVIGNNSRYDNVAIQDGFRWWNPATRRRRSG